MLSAIEQTRLRVSKGTEAKRKSQLGQFLTPAKTARFMAGLFPPASQGVCRLLDPGAGIGSLSSAFLERCVSGDLRFDKVELSAFELDNLLHHELKNTLAVYSERMPLSFEVFGSDFIEEAVNRIQFSHHHNFTHAILNPPYKKINSDSRHRLLLRQVGIETINLYSAFVALALALMSPGGYLVAIIPRSFCNGPYYRPFRKFVLERAAIRCIHLFASRNQAFKDDGVLQENVIIMLERGGPPGDVIVSNSTDDNFTDLMIYTYAFDHIVFPNDQEQFIHIPASPRPNIIEKIPAIQYSLDDLDLQVSTGPVVDFRLKNHLCNIPKPGTVPLLYPSHFKHHCIEWPRVDTKKPNAILCNEATEKWLYPTGFYCVVRRLSSKEENRRIVASVVKPSAFPDAQMLGFENHLNIFHEGKQGLPEALAYGLAMFLNTTAVDDHFRRFNGHTQVNATDLRLIKYPSRAALMVLGEWAMRCGQPTQAMIDEQLEILSA